MIRHLGKFLQDGDVMGAALNLKDLALYYGCDATACCLIYNLAFELIISLQK